MRWNVEVTSMDKSDAQSVVVEAESWQKALQAARASRGDSGPISGFSIELLDEGYRAVDPLARLRYDVKRATDDAALTANAKPAAAPTPPPPAPVAVPAAVAAPTPPPPAVTPAPTTPTATVVTAPAPAVVSTTPTETAAPVAASSATPGVTPAPPVAAAHAPPRPSARAAAPAAPVPVHVAPTPTKKPPPPPSVRSAPPVAPAPIPIESVSSSELEPLVENGAADATIRTEPLAESASTAEATRAAPMPIFPPPHVGLQGTASAYGPGPAYTPPPPPLTTPSADATGPVPPTQVIFKREHDPSDRLPLTYREYVFTVARGVDEAAAERLLRVQLDQVRASIAHARPGKFVNLAVFDVVFQGRPPVPPLVTLAWKDWKGDAVVSFPRRPPLPNGPPIAPQRIVSVVPSPPPSERPIPPPPPDRPAPVFAPPVETVPAAPVFPVPAAAPALASHAVTPAAPPPPPPPPVGNNPFTAVTGAVVADPFTPGPAPLPTGVPVPQAFPQPHSTADGHASHQAAPVPASAPTQNLQPAHPQHGAHAPHRRADSSQRLLARGSASRLTPTPSRPSLRPLDAGRRATGDELIANLFEAMHELQFTRDVVEGGDYVLALALEMLPSRAGIVHLYDINRREFVVACVSGASTDVLLGRRYPETEPLFATAMRKRRALVVSDAKAEGGVGDRFQALGGVSSLICSPVLHGGRFLGVIEIVDPSDGIPFTEHEANAIDYMSEQFAEYVASRGMDLDEERISRRAPPMGP